MPLCATGPDSGPASPRSPSSTPLCLGFHGVCLDPGLDPLCLPVSTSGLSRSTPASSLPNRRIKGASEPPGQGRIPDLCNANTPSRANKADAPSARLLIATSLWTSHCFGPCLPASRPGSRLPSQAFSLGFHGRGSWPTKPKKKTTKSQQAWTPVPASCLPSLNSWLQN